MKITKETERHIRRLARNRYGYQELLSKKLSKEDLKIALEIVMSAIDFFLAELGIDYRDYAKEDWRNNVIS